MGEQKQKIIEMKTSREFAWMAEHQPRVLDEFSKAFMRAMEELRGGVKDDVSMVTTYLCHDGEGFYSSHDVVGRDYASGVIMLLTPEQRDRLFGRMTDDR